jgi:importin subunit alpha-1
MCDLLQSMDNKIIQVALDGLENILKVGEIDKEAAGPGGINQYAQFVEEAGGMVSIHNLQHHENLEIYKKCFYIMDSESSLLNDILGWGADEVEFFPDDDEEEAEDAAPAVDASGQYAFQSDGKLFLLPREAS